MAQTNVGKAIFYGCCVTISYCVSAFVNLATDSFSEFYSHCHVELPGREILYIAIALGLLSCLDAVTFSSKIRRVIVFSCVSYLLMNVYAGLLQTSSTTQLNLIEILLRKQLNVGIIVTSEFLLILITKTILYSLFQEIIKCLYRMIVGRPTKPPTKRRSIYAPDVKLDFDGNRIRPQKRVKFQ